MSKQTFLLAMLVAAALVFAGCHEPEPGNDDPVNGEPDPNGETEDISIVTLAFDPDNITVAVNTTVTWTNEDSVDHTVTAEDGSFDSENLTAGASFSHLFTEPGQYDYICELHPTMTATVVVEEDVAT